MRPSWSTLPALLALAAAPLTACFNDSQPSGSGGTTGDSNSGGSTSNSSMTSDSGPSTSSGTSTSASTGGDGLGNGESCESSDECNSGFCVDGLCCNAACEGGCQMCDVGGSEGTCTPVAQGADPNGACPAGDGQSAICAPGGCNGAGACILAPITTECRSGSCVDGVAIDRAFCEADGTCPDLTMTVCEPYSCGGNECNSACSGPGACAADQYCENNSGTCMPKKVAGVGCLDTAECGGSLTCVDSVCCSAAACPTCMNCGATGMCNVPVVAAPDTSGTACDGTNTCDASGVCKFVLGEDCGGAGECASANCLDGFCCDASACSTCENCSNSGSCDAGVASQDDNSGQVCQAAQTCDAGSSCVTRWTKVGSFAAAYTIGGNYSTVVGNVMYMGGTNNNKYHKQFNTQSLIISDAPTTNWDYCWCGYTGVSVSDGNSIFYFGNDFGNDGDGERLTPGDASWVSLPGYSAANVPDGENATAYLNGRVWRVGGRDYPRRVSSYNIATDQWTLAGYPQYPEVDGDSHCAGGANNKLYVFGDLGVNEFDPGTNQWTVLPLDPNDPGCYLRELHTWGNYLVYANGAGIQRFNLGTKLWEATPIVGPNASQQNSRAMVANGKLYAITWDNAAKLVNIWRYEL